LNTEIKNRLIDKATTTLGSQEGRKFVEAKTGEVIHVRESGESFYQRAPQAPMIAFTDIKKLFELVTPGGTSSPQVSASGRGSVSFPVAINPISRKYETAKSQTRPQSAFQVPQAMRTSPGQQLFRRAPAPPMKGEQQRFSPSIMFLNQGGPPQHSTPTNNPLGMP